MDSAVKFEDVYKEYPLYHHMTAGLKSFLFHLPKNIASLRRTKFAALKGVSLEVARGETFGIIGKNGSGKSTMLGLIAGVIRPDRGSVEVSGKISSLLELGAGFHPDLSGIENIILNGILMGNTKDQMLKKIDAIIEFSELGDFIYQPLRTYSSGMHVRLGFSVAVHVDPEILVVDEALAVGDLKFQEKCHKKMREFREAGATIILVSHGMSAIAKLCDRAAWLDAGEVMAVGKPKEVIGKYLRHIGQEDSFCINEEKSSTDTGESPEGIPDRVEVSERVGDKLMPTGGKHEGPEALPAEPGRPPVSWWDSSTVMRQCKISITGSPDVSLCDFLKRYISAPLEKGLSVCLKLHWLESTLAACNACKAFDVIDDEDKIEGLFDGEADFGENQYDLFLCADLLHRIKNIDLFLRSVERALTEKGVVIALEYVGPAGFLPSGKDVLIADALCRMMYHGDGAASLLSAPTGAGRLDSTRGISRDGVIPALGRVFDVAEVRYFGGPLFDLVLNRILEKFGSDNEKDAALIKTIMNFERVLMNEGVIGKNYALVLARKK